MSDEKIDTQSTDSKERRRDPRIERSTEVAFEVSFLDDRMTPVKLNSKTLDISKSGIRMTLSQELPIGFITELCIENAQGRMMLLFAEVKWCRPEGQIFQCGLELMDAEDSDLHHWINQLPPS